MLINIIKKLLSGKSIESRIFRMGCYLFVLEFMFLVFLFIFQPESFMNVVTVFTTGVVGGRLMAISLGLEFGFHPVNLILLLCFFNSTWLFMFYPLVSMFFDYIVDVRILGKMLNTTRKIAEMQKKRIEKYGSLGLFVFVWLPLPWTGSLIGAIIGKLTGLSTRKSILIVVPAMLLGIYMWTVAFNDLFGLFGIIGKGIPTIYLVLFVFCISLFIRVRRSRKLRKKQE